MYEKTLQLKKRPFTAALCVEHWCDVGNAGNVVQQICGVVSRGMGISVVVGGAGTGKTMTLEMIARQCADRNPEIVQISCSRLDQRRDILQRILFELNIPCRDLTDSDLRLTVIQHFRSICGQHGRDVLLLVDEAHNLPIELLDELRNIVESAARNQGRCQLVIAGTARLEDHLNHTELDTFNQRIVCRGYLAPMNREETATYVRQHLTRAGGGNREYFTADALREISNVTGGVPRLVNQLCDQCLVGLAASHGQTVSAEAVNYAWCDIQNLPRQKKNSGFVVAPATENTESVDSVEFGSLDDDFEASTAKVARPVTQQPAANPVAMPVEKPAAAKSENSVLQKTYAAKTTREIPQPMRTIVANLGPDPFGETFETEEPVVQQQTKSARAGKSPKKQRTVNPNSALPAAANQPESHDTNDESLVSTIYGSTETVSAVEFSDQSISEIPAFESKLTSTEISDFEQLSDHDEQAGESADSSGEDGVTIPLQQTVRKSARFALGTDDRDILLTCEETCFDPTPSESDESDPRDDQTGGGSSLKGPHKARAVRMDYHKLFAQLRDESA